MGVLPLSTGEMEKIYSAHPHPRNFSNKKRMCHFKLSFSSPVHICFGFRSKLNSVKFQFLFHCRKHLN